MRNSFVFHFDYLEDVPEELQPVYAMHVINYARYGESPAFDDWRDQRMWNKTKQRMDEEAEKYERKCRNLRHQQEPEDQEQLPTYDNGVEDKPKQKRFVKPTVDQVREYCQERHNSVDPQNFINFYEAKGWKVGKTPMKDWKACVRTWETRDRRGPVQQPAKALPADRLTL